jgi:hypothetical protein
MSCIESGPWRKKLKIRKTGFIFQNPQQ